MTKKAIGIDIGGTGIKGALVDVSDGTLLSERVRYETPESGSPVDIARVVVKLVNEIQGAKPRHSIGICFPAVIKDGHTMSAANISKEWIGLDARKLFTEALGRRVSIVNDADAAGEAEVKFGAGRRRKGLVIMTTLGTGIGSALLMNGRLIPNSELGHLEIDGQDAEKLASFAAKERDNLSFAEWAKRLQRYYSHLDALFSPDLIIVGGGVSKQHEQFLPLLDINAEIVPAIKRNNAGILGAATYAFNHEND